MTITNNIILFITRHPIIVGLFVFSLAFYQYFKARKVPGLPGLPHTPFFGTLFKLLEHADRAMDYQLECCEAFDGKYTSGLPNREPFICNPSVENTEWIMKTNFSNYQKGPQFKQIFHELLGDGIFNSDGKAWQDQRKMASHVFSMRQLRTHMTQVFTDNCYKVLDILEEKKEDEVFDFATMASAFTLDSFGEIAFGVQVNCLTEKVPFAYSFDRVQQLIETRFINPIWTIQKFFQMGNEKEITKHIKVLDTFVYDIIKNRRESSDDLDTRGDLLSRFMSLDDKESQDDGYLRDVIMNFIIAGRDTTAVALTWMLYEICMHPEVEEKILEELTAEMKKGQSEVELSYELVGRLPYTHAVMSESLRLHPPVPRDSKSSINSDTLPDGTKIPGGTTVSYGPYVWGRWKPFWGEDANEFKPERFVENPNPSPFQYTVFNAGPRLCLGKHVAYLEAKLLLAAMLPKYKFHICGPPVQTLPKTYQMSVTLPMKDGLKMTVSRR